MTLASWITVHPADSRVAIPFWNGQACALMASRGADASAHRTAGPHSPWKCGTFLDGQPLALVISNGLGGGYDVVRDTSLDSLSLEAAAMPATRRSLTGLFPSIRLSDRSFLDLSSPSAHSIADAWSGVDVFVRAQDASQSTDDAAEDRIQSLAERCDLVGGFQFLFDSADPGCLGRQTHIASAIVSDLFPKTDILNWLVLDGGSGLDYALAGTCLSSIDHSTNIILGHGARPREPTCLFDMPSLQAMAVQAALSAAPAPSLGALMSMSLRFQSSSLDIRKAKEWAQVDLLLLDNRVHYYTSSPSSSGVESKSPVAVYGQTVNKAYIPCQCHSWGKVVPVAFLEKLLKHHSVRHDDFGWRDALESLLPCN